MMKNKFFDKDKMDFTLNTKILHNVLYNMNIIKTLNTPQKAPQSPNLHIHSRGQKQVIHKQQLMK